MPGNLLRPADDATLDHVLRRLQYVLPVVILIFVAFYAFAFENLLPANLDPVVGFALHFALFGLFGAAMAWLALGWLRRFVAAQAAREREARARERLLATITSNSADAIILLDTHDHILSWNQGAEQLFGYTAEEMVGRHFERIVPQDRRSELERIDAILREKGFVRGWITQRITRSGQKLTVELTRTLLRDDKGAHVGSSTILRDVTERERVEAEIRELNRHLETQVAQRTRELAQSNRELRKRQSELENANEELKQLDQLKSEFVSLVSHELRAPLANISGSLELLLSDNRGLSGNQRELIAVANEQVARLARLVRGILNVSRIEAGQTLLQLQAFDVRDLLERMLNQWQNCDPDHLYLLRAAENIPSIWADRDRLEEVLTNLLENAFKYSDSNTQISVDIQAQQDLILIAVSDQGEGMAPHELARIFDKFYRVERDDARKSYGYGLGLYISFKLVEAMGGKLWAESELDKGSTFYLALPSAGHAAPAHTLATAVAAN